MTVRRAVPAGWLAAGLAAGLLFVVVAALGVGRYAIGPLDVLRAAAGLVTGDGAVAPAARTVLWGIRLPRVAAAVLVGAALSAAGAAYQSLFRNPLVSPDILGVSAGAGFGALLGIYLGLPVTAVQALAFAGGLAAVAVVTAVAARVRRHDPVLVLVLAGVAVGAVLGAASSLLKILADPYTQLPSMTYWLLGGFVGTTASDVAAAAPVVLVGLGVLWLLRWRVNVLSQSDEEAMALGVDPARVRLVLVGAATLTTAAAVAISGIVGWVGLVVPHVSRLLVGPDFRRLLPVAATIGATFVVAADTVARAAAPTEIPFGLLAALGGGPFFLWLLARSRRAW